MNTVSKNSCMKRLFSLIVCFCTLISMFSFFPVASFAAGTAKLEVRSNENNSLKVAFCLVDSADITNFDIRIKFDDSVLEYKGYSVDESLEKRVSRDYFYGVNVSGNTVSMSAIFREDFGDNAKTDFIVLDFGIKSVKKTSISVSGSYTLSLSVDLSESVAPSDKENDNTSTPSKPGVVFESLKGFYYGDVNKDKKVTAADARLILRDSVNLEKFSDEICALADVNLNGAVDTKDARTTLRMSVGLDDMYLYGEEIHEHDYVVEVITTVSCTKDGLEKKTCKICNAVKEIVVPKGHQWEAATCSSPKKCKLCNKTEGSALAHSFKAATCTTAKTCTICGYKDGYALGHTYSNRVCTRCGAAQAKKYASSITNATYAYDIRVSSETSVPKLDWRAAEAIMKLCKVWAKELGISSSSIDSATYSYDIRVSSETSVPKLEWRATEVNMKLLKLIARQLGVSSSSIDTATYSYDIRVSSETSVPKLEWRATEVNMKLLKLIARQLGASSSSIDSATYAYDIRVSSETSVPKLEWRATEANMKLLKLIAKQYGASSSSIDSATYSYDIRVSSETSVPKLEWRATEACMKLLVVITKLNDTY